ncbi:MAG: 50S ribosomal protein L15 [Candidatus Omnitrophota bacterium]
MKIQDIRRPKGAHKFSRRLGRGPGSGRGKTSGRGHKGASSRSGSNLRLGFEGGQMTLIRRVPKRGFTSVAKVTAQFVNVEGLNHFKKDSCVDKSALKEAGFIKSATLPVKVLGEGKIAKPITVVADAFSASAKKKIEEAGGKADIVKKELKK